MACLTTVIKHLRPIQNSTASTACFLFIILLFTAIHVNADNCAHQKYNRNINEIVDIKIEKLQHLNTLKEYNFDVQVSVFPNDKLVGLNFYGGAIQHGIPTELHSVMNYHTENGKHMAWFMANTKNFNSTKLFLWYKNQECHISASFMLSDHKQSLKFMSQPQLAASANSM